MAKSTQERLAIGSYLRAARLRAGHDSMREVATLTGIDRTNIVHLENGRRLPTYQLIAKLVQQAGYDPRVIFPRRAPGSDQPIT